jgi:two-component system KDP operon response regulator KdpE
LTESMHQVLVVEDDAALRGVLGVLLRAERYRVVEAETVRRGEIEARGHRPDLLLVDLGLPDASGIELIRRVRAWSPVPIIVLSARTQEAQKIEAFAAGADDYVTKPFGSAELMARVRAALRRSARSAERPSVAVLGEARVDLGARTAAQGEQPLHLTPLEYRVLECLSRQAGLVVTQRQLLREAWGPDKVGDTRALRVCIRNLRAKLEPDPGRPRYIVTETGLGYRLAD